MDLQRDHHELEKILRDAARMVDDEERERAEHTFDEFRARLERHMRMEEDVLFAPFEREQGLTARAPTFLMRLEHVEIGRLVEELRLALQLWRPERFRAGVRDLEQFLHAHDAREEALLDRLVAQDVREIRS